MQRRAVRVDASSRCGPAPTALRPPSAFLHLAAARPRGGRRAVLRRAAGGAGISGAPLVRGADNFLQPPYPDVVVFLGGRAFQEEALVPMCVAEERAAPARPALRKEGSVGSRASLAARGGGAGGAGGDGAAAARLVLARGFRVQDGRLVGPADAPRGAAP
jgi:hypothetical protein